MKKSELRKKYLEKRNTLSSDEIAVLSQKIFQNFVATFLPESGQNIHIFLSIEKFKEIDTQIFVNYFFKKNINVFVPRMSGGKLESVQITPETVYKENKWGIFEPEDSASDNIFFDFVITPLLYCDSEGNRVGYGKGFYDRFFAEINAKALKIGINFFPPGKKIDDISESDIPLDYLVTPDAVLSFGDL
ncbi:MAG: 5-formyltetrahydrofolate cyclo-ligase [Bergeyella sp.]